MIALIAYMQRLGTDIFKEPEPAAEPAAGPDAGAEEGSEDSAEPQTGLEDSP